MTGSSGRAAAQRARNSSMASHLKAMGIPHGRVMSTTCAPPIPKMTDVGSAAYRRKMRKLGQID